MLEKNDSPRSIEQAKKSSLKAIHPSSKNLQHLSYCFIICPLILWVEHTFISVFMWVQFSL